MYLKMRKCNSTNHDRDDTQLIGMYATRCMVRSERQALVHGKETCAELARNGQGLADHDSCQHNVQVRSYLYHRTENLTSTSPQLLARAELRVVLRVRVRVRLGQVRSGEVGLG